MGVCKRVKIVVDTNFLLLLASGVIAPSLIDRAIDYAYDLLVPDSVIKELKKLEKTAPQAKTRKLAGKALLLLSEGRIAHGRIPSKAENTDDDLILIARELAAKNCRTLIATNDRELRRRARQAGIPTLYYRESKALLEADWTL